MADHGDDVTRYDNYIAGQWVSASQVIDNINPSNTADVIGSYAQADADQVANAIAAAHAATSAWAQSGVQTRFDALDAIGSEILANKDALGDMLAREEGKTLPEAIGEVGRAGQIFKFFAGETVRTGGEYLPSVRAGVEVEIRREPLGVLGIVTPLEFSHRDPGLENRASVGLRELCGVQARKPGVG